MLANYFTNMAVKREVEQTNTLSISSRFTPIAACNARRMTAAPTEELPPWPSVQQVAAWLDVDQKTVRRYIAQGRLKGVRIGPRLIRVERESILALVKPIGCY